MMAPSCRHGRTHAARPGEQIVPRLDARRSLARVSAAADEHCPLPRSDAPPLFAACDTPPEPLVVETSRVRWHGEVVQGCRTEGFAIASERCERLALGLEAVEHLPAP